MESASYCKLPLICNTHIRKLIVGEESSDYVYLAGFDRKGMEPYVDFYNYMAYDSHGPWEEAILVPSITPYKYPLFIHNATTLVRWRRPIKINFGYHD